MTRRTAILALLLGPMAAAKLDAAPVHAGAGTLTLDLSAWGGGVVVKYPGQPDVTVSAREVYEALRAK